MKSSELVISDSLKMMKTLIESVITDFDLGANSLNEAIDSID